MARRIYITGAAGAGTSCLGQALSARLGLSHLDTDDFYWAPSDTPFTVKYPVPERCAAIADAQAAAMTRGGWVLSGSADGWGDAVLSPLDLILFLRTPTPVRLMRIRRRETEKFGPRIGPGGDMELNHRKFLTWAASYDDTYFGGRSLTRHREWLAVQDAPVLELSGMRGVDEMVAEAVAHLSLRPGAQSRAPQGLSRVG